MLRKLALLLVLASSDVHAGVVYRSVWYPDGYVRYRNGDVRNFAPGALDAVMRFYREHTPIDIAEVTEGEPNLTFQSLSGFGLAMTPGYLDPSWPDALKALLFERPGIQSADTIAHELMHALGFAHEHQRPDRDAWVDTCFNLDPFNYGIVGPAPYWVTSPYDYSSIMHYEVCVTPTRAAVMTPRYRGRPTLLSVHDVNSLYRFYGRPLGALQPSGPEARGDFDDDGFADRVVAHRDRRGSYVRVWLYFYRGVATDPSEGLAPVVEVPWFRELVTVTWSKQAPTLTSRDVNADAIADLELVVGKQRWTIVVNVPGEGFAPWGRKGIASATRAP